MMGYYDFTDFSPFLERMKKGELTLEEILNNDSIIEDIKTKDQSEFLDFFTNDQMKKLIDYSTRFPKSDDHNTGYKYPFNSTEILCTENIIFYNKLMTEKIIKEKNEKNKKAKDFMKRIHKGGFFEVFFKIPLVWSRLCVTIKSLRARMREHVALIAQLVEQAAVNRWVQGSSPCWGACDRMIAFCRKTTP